MIVPMGASDSIIASAQDTTPAKHRRRFGGRFGHANLYKVPMPMGYD